MGGILDSSFSHTRVKKSCWLHFLTGLHRLFSNQQPECPDERLSQLMLSIPFASVPPVDPTQPMLVLQRVGPRPPHGICRPFPMHRRPFFPLGSCAGCTFQTFIQPAVSARTQTFDPPQHSLCTPKLLPFKLFSIALLIARERTHTYPFSVSRQRFYEGKDFGLYHSPLYPPHADQHLA